MNEDNFLLILYASSHRWLTNLQLLLTGKSLSELGHIIDVLYPLKQSNNQVSGYGADWLAEVIVNYSLDLTNKFKSSFLIRMMKVRLRSSCTFIITFVLLNCFQILCTVNQRLWNLHNGSFSIDADAIQYTVSKFLDKWIASWWCFPHGQHLNDSKLMHNRQNQKKIKFLCEINFKWCQFTHLTL